jgi:hypothetical protein
MRSRATALVPLVLVALQACANGPGLPLALPRASSGAPRVPRWDEPRREVRRELGPTGQVVSLRELLVLPSGETLAHGRDAAWFPGGGLSHDRFFLEGEPAGLWRSWFLDGKPHSAVWCGDGPGTTRWWYPNGRLSARGAARGAVKEGEWTFWYESGEVSEEGAYRGGERHGLWSLWYDGGGPRARGAYDNGVRVGTWEAWSADGTRTVRAVPVEAVEPGP